MIIIKKSLCILLAALLFLASSCASQTEVCSDTFFLFDTIITLTVYGDKSALDGAFELCAGYESLLSKTYVGSDVWRINHAEGQSVEVSAETAYLINLAIDHCEMSGGRFDITVEPLVSLWDFSGGDNIVPDSDTLLSAAKLVDYTKIEISSNTVTLPAGMSIDLGAIAKGYIADKLAEYFRSNDGVSGALINLGGNILTVGSKPDGSQWAIGIRDPSGDVSDYLAVLHVDERSIVTSGIYERSFTKDDVLYHHLLDPNTGMPVNNELASVTVISDSSAQGDALSTVFYLMGLDEGLDTAERMDNIEAVFILLNGEVYHTSGVDI